MPVLIFLIFLAGVLVWLLLSFVYKPLGSFVLKIFGDAKESMTEDDDKEKKG